MGTLSHLELELFRPQETLGMLLVGYEKLPIALVLALVLALARRLQEMISVID